MPVNFCLTLCQLNPTVGDISGNAAKAVTAHQRGKQKNADFVALPEMFLTGYQTQDLVTKPAFLESVAVALLKLANDCADGPALGIGAPVLEDGKLYNGYFVLKNGAVHALTRKHHLPNTHVFDEKRLFESASISGPFNLGPIRIGTPICEDAWHEDVCETMAESGADLLMVPNEIGRAHV